MAKAKAEDTGSDAAPKGGFLENVTFDEIKIGQKAGLTRALTHEDIDLFAAVSGDVNPAYMDPDYAKGDGVKGIVGHGMWSGALVSAVLGTVLPGPGSVPLAQNMRFLKPVRVGDLLTVTVTVRDKEKDRPVVLFDCMCANDKGETVMDGTASVLALRKKISVTRPDMPDVDVQTHDYYREIIDACQKMEPVQTAIVHPVQATVLLAIEDAVKENLIRPVLIGPAARIKAAAVEGKINISKWKIIDVEHSHAAAMKAVELAAAGKVGAIMKGSLHTDELLGAIISSNSGLRTGRRMSHVFLMDVPSYHKPIMITDAALNIAPDLVTKADICQNAIDLWRILFGQDKKPKVAILAAVETINPKMNATLDAAALCKMADRGQITNGLLDGPLAFDNAVSVEAAKGKGIVSEVAGDADILLVPSIESGNALAKQLTFLGKADAAGILLGARVPVILTSRADNLRARLMSCALAVKMSWARKEGKVK